MRVVITGGAGFIGANLARELTARPEVAEVRVVDDLSTGSKANLAGVDVTLFEGTILDPALLDAAFTGADAVVHLAALPSVPRSVAAPLASHHANATGTLEVLEAAAGPAACTWRRRPPPRCTAPTASCRSGSRCAPRR
ncbi:NAD-dependent epimerase/dehydratase family protein [Kitasatospora cheerisanensis]|uniref:GDP-D-mannose dehydratase n=1 Tax=Kitasatospora cheerisanensis KCTC 2395 TaxID=1348663 RepID=A0A066Z8A3_9ACTN|nr:NAD-dependent epimerase/dehydratase family protein [Kitasatospora cheerisanensis]KDN86556.1 GDP-D-mannose dehydratase [Kitasatospora cheerisanensis KCTC 2395]